MPVNTLSIIQKVVSRISRIRLITLLNSFRIQQNLFIQIKIGHKVISMLNRNVETTRTAKKSERSEDKKKAFLAKQRDFRAKREAHIKRKCVRIEGTYSRTAAENDFKGNSAE